MNESALNLRELQRWMQSVIVHPQGVEAGLRSDEARQYVNVTESTLDSVIEPSRALTSFQRLFIYGHAYYARLLECLRAVYPTLAHALGGKTFDVLAMAYLQAYPSRSYTLDKLGSRFARFLEETRPDRSTSEGDVPSSAASWPDLLIDLARFDWAIGEVFDGPGSEGKLLLTAVQISAVPPDRWSAMRVVPAPALRLLELRFPINDYFTAIRADENPPLPDAGETYVALTRHDYVVCRYELSREEHAVLSALIAGDSIAGALARGTADADGHDIDRFAMSVSDWFRRWTANEFFQAIH